MKQIDLNADLGESFGSYTIGQDEDLLKLITSANIACGFHASDPLVMAKTVAQARENGVRVGAHPGFPDLQGFGRRPMTLTTEEIRAITVYQVGALYGFCRAEKITMQHVKPHGALYNMAVKNDAIADAICSGVAAVDRDLILIGPANSCLTAAALRAGLPVANEVFADRAYEEDGSLVPRGRPGAMIPDAQEAARRVLRMLQVGTVTAITGKEIPVRADTVCIHGDSSAALAFARSVRKALLEAQVELRSLS